MGFWEIFFYVSELSYLKKIKGNVYLIIYIDDDLINKCFLMLKFFIIYRNIWRYGRVGLYRSF